MSLLAEIRQAPFREKTAWVMALILSVNAAFYFEHVASTSRALGQTAPPVIGFVIGYVILIAIAASVALATLTGASPQDADAPADEREQRIEDKAGNWSGYVTGLPAFGALFLYAINRDGNMLFHLVFLSLVLGQIADYVFQIFLYRRGL